MIKEEKAQALIRDVIQFFGSRKEFAHALDCTPQNSNMWHQGYRKVPVIKALEIENLTKGKFKACDLRPDVKILKKVVINY